MRPIRDVVVIDMLEFAGHEERRRKTDLALQEAWKDRARCHELLTKEGVPPGDLEWRISWVIARLRTGMDPWSEGP